MAKQIVNIGTSPNQGNGDPLRTAFTKINENFTELYTALGLNADTTLNLGAFEFTGSTMSTTDSSPITIDQSTTITSDLAVGGDILPSVANGGNLGSSANPWRSLYVSNNTIYIGGNALKIDGNGDLTLNNNRIVQENGEYLVLDNLTDVSANSPSVGDVLTWNGGSWVNGGQVDLGKFKIANNNLGTVDNPNTGGWGGYGINIDPGNGSDAAILIPGLAGQAGGTALQIYNLGDATSPLQLWGRGNVQVVTGQGATEKVFTFESNSLIFPDSTTQTTAFTGVASNIESENDISIKINLTDSTQRIWRFGEDGDLRFPDGTVQTTAWNSEADTLDSVTDRGATTTNNITVGSLITEDITAKLGNATGNIVSSVRFWDSAGANLYIWFSAAATPELVTLGSFGNINGWTVSLSSGNSATVTATNPAGYFSISTDVALTGSGTLTFTSPDYAPPAPLPIDINVGANTWTFNSNGTLTFPNGSLALTDSVLNNGLDADIKGSVFGDDSTKIIDAIENKIYTNELTFTDGTITAGKNITVPLDEDFTVTLQYDMMMGQGVQQRQFIVSNDSITLPTGNGRIFAGSGEWGLDSANKVLSFPNNDLIHYDGSAGSGGSDYGLNLFTYTKPVIITSGQTNSWTFGTDGNLTIPGDIKSQGNINIEINLGDSTLRRWSFGEDGYLTFPDTTVQSTAFTGNAATVDITNTNGIDTNYSITFVENRDAAQYLRGDVDLTFNSATNLLTAGNITTGILKIEDGVHERFQTKADATGTVTHDCDSGNIFYHTSPDANWTANFINPRLDSGYATAVTLVIVQGGTGYYPNAVEINGIAQTINWQGNTTPTPSSNRVDVVTFSIINNGGTLTVLGQLTGF